LHLSRCLLCPALPYLPCPRSLQLSTTISQQRKDAEAREAEVQRQRAERRRATREKAEAVRRKQMRHVLFTSPEVVKVGSDGWAGLVWSGLGWAGLGWAEGGVTRVG
jgi:hypothetical protein